MYSKETQKELFERQLIICGQENDVQEIFADLNDDTGEVTEAIIDDSLANCVRLLMYGNEEEILNLVTYTRNKLYQMEILL